VNVVSFPGRPWTRADLLTAYDMAGRNCRLADIGRKIGRTARDVDLMLWAVLSTETVGQALELLNGEGDGGVRSASVTR
jgi:hypothetical protein